MELHLQEIRSHLPEIDFNFLFDTCLREPPGIRHRGDAGPRLASRPSRAGRAREARRRRRR
jgi:hypothetical protein